MNGGVRWSSSSLVAGWVKPNSAVAVARAVEAAARRAGSGWGCDAADDCGGAGGSAWIGRVVGAAGEGHDGRLLRARCGERAGGSVSAPISGLALSSGVTGFGDPGGSTWAVLATATPTAASAASRRRALPGRTRTTGESRGNVMGKPTGTHLGRDSRSVPAHRRGAVRRAATPAVRLLLFARSATCLRASVSVSRWHEGQGDLRWARQRGDRRSSVRTHPGDRRDDREGREAPADDEHRGRAPGDPARARDGDRRRCPTILSSGTTLAVRSTTSWGPTRSSRSIFDPSSIEHGSLVSFWSLSPSSGFLVRRPSFQTSSVERSTRVQECVSRGHPERGCRWLLRHRRSALRRDPVRARAPADAASRTKRQRC